MNRQVMQGIAAFIAVCGMGLFAANAGGTHWGTSEAAAASVITMFMAIFAFVVVSFFPRGL